MGYIYKIINKVNGKMYIGKTEYFNPIKRWKEHINTFERGNDFNRPIYKAMKKYGINNFCYEIIEKVDDNSILCEREIYWINKLRTYVGFKNCAGYNATLGGDGKSRYNLNQKEVIDKYFEFHKNMAKTARFYDVNINTIREILKNNNIKLNTYQQTLRELQSHKVLALDKDTLEVVYTFESITSANVFFKKDKTNGNIRNAIKNPDKSAYGYKWVLAS